MVGGSLQIDEQRLAKGVLIVEFDWPLDGRSIGLRAIYPDSFPRLRPNVRLQGDPSTFQIRHCSPIDGNLCLLGRDSAQWRQQWTLRKLLEKQLADTLNDSGEEDPQGEPAEYWWNIFGCHGSYCLVDSSWTLDGALHGSLHLRYRLQMEPGKGKVPEIQAVVTEVRNEKGDLIQSWHGALPPEIEVRSKEITIPWTYVDEVILPNGSDLQRIYQQIEAFKNRLATSLKIENFSSSIKGKWFAVIYKMEVAFRAEGLGWLFPLYIGPKKCFRRSKSRKQKARGPNIIILPTYRAGEVDLGARVPAARLLRDKKIAVVGVGAVGAPIAVELARNRCQLLHLLDQDRVEPGNSIRWPLGVSAWGKNKTNVLAEFLRREFPWTEVKEHSHLIGSIDEGNPAKGDDTLFEDILNDVDLLVDGTASYGISTFLSDLCRSHGLPLIALYASPPVEGGIVARFAPNSGCPTCLEFAYNAGTIEPAPGFDDQERGMQQPPGCAERTFTGASFDLQELSLQAVRLIVETLENPGDSDVSLVYTVSLISNGERKPPTWRVDTLPRGEKCSCAGTL